ncbi:MAG: polysaccharide deacetylase family protein [Poseidonia sp.]
MTVDTDDLRHLPKHQGHPTRSTQPFSGPFDELSPEFQQGWAGFVDWMASHQGAVTLFVITDLLENPDFASALRDALKVCSGRLTVGCHGHTHRSWSAWGEDIEGFRAMLETSTTLLKTHAGPAFRPYFRAPNGYIAPWMAAVLAEAGYLVDSSVNPSWLVKSKAGGSTWNGVVDAMDEAGVVERSWLTRWTLPVNGPALFKFPLSLNAKPAWRRAPPLLGADDLSVVEDPKQAITTLYCHVLDFARNAGTWRPPR